MGIQNPGTFVTAVLVFLALPGPGTFALLTASGKHGIRAGYATLTGLALGDQVLMWLAALGVAALLKANPTLFHVLQYLGAAYLVWVGLQLLLKKGGGESVQMQPGHFLRQGFLISVLNPKAVLFYMAFFPLFIDPGNHHGLWTIAAMALTIVVLSLLYCSMLILLGHGMSRKVRRHPRLRRVLQGIAGLCLIGFGIQLGIGWESTEPVEPAVAAVPAPEAMVAARRFSSAPSARMASPWADPAPAARVAAATT